MADLVRVGPIVGEVTETTARVVVQPVDPGLVQVVLTPAGGGPALTGQATATAQRPVAGVSVTGLAPGTEYALSVKVGGAKAAGRTGRIRTKSAGVDTMVVAAVSCNFTIRQGAARLWERLRDKWVVPGTVTTVLHVGDQIYGDDAFQASLEDVKRRGRGGGVVRAAKQRFRDLYFYSWNYDATRTVLANASNLMIWDDHELCNSWGSYDAHRDPKSDEFFVGKIARTVFQEFQRQLWDAPDADVAHEAHAHAYGSLGVVFLDQRTARSFRHDPQRPYLGPTQWAWLRNTLASPAFADVRALVLVTSVPLCYVSPFVANTGGLLISDLRDHWSYPDHRTEQIELLTAIRRWKADVPGRTVLVVGGDVHVGGRTIIENRTPTGWDELCHQIITSPVTNVPPGGLAWFGMSNLLLSGMQDVTESYRYVHRDMTRRRNFAILTMRGGAGAAATIPASLEEDADD